jgi:virginiamycin A acetyltransferase
MLNPVLQELLFRLYRARIWRKFVLAILARYDGGNFRSLCIRRIFMEYHRIEVGLFSYGGCFNPNRIASGTKIGKFCSFAPSVDVYAADHKINAVTTHPFIYNPVVGIVKEDLREIHKIEFGNDIWVGQNAIFIAGVHKVGDGAVIGAGAVVTRAVPPYAVVGGVPAKIIKYRFKEDIVAQLLRIQWWNWKPERIFRLQKEFNSIDSFLQVANKQEDTWQDGRALTP